MYYNIRPRRRQESQDVGDADDVFVDHYYYNMHCVYYIIISGPVDDRIARTLVTQMMCLFIAITYVLYLLYYNIRPRRRQDGQDVGDADDVLGGWRPHQGPYRENTFYSTQREHILYWENAHQSRSTERENTFYAERTHSISREHTPRSM